VGLIWLIPLSGVLSLGFVAYLAWDILRSDTGTPEMQAVGGTVYEGAVAFIKRQYTTIGVLAVITAILITVLVAVFEHFSETAVVGWGLGIRTGVAFLIGAATSTVSGIIGMYVAVKSNVRTASAAGGGVGPALRIALRGGAVSGFLVVTLSLLGVYAMFLLYGGLRAPQNAPFLIVGMGFGASFVALFAQLGGGIYTKAADVGADLVGKVEAGIPEDDPRNAGVVAERAVSKTAERIIEEVRRQFREIPGLLEGKGKPDYARAVDITTRGALGAMIGPGLLAVSVPIIAGVLLGAEAEAALLMVGTISGIVLASVMNNGGGAWDNAKKYIEAHGVRDDQGHIEGKGSEAHKASVVGDTVGDPFKDTAGPSLHVLIKLLSTITLVLAALFI
jgi:Na+/H+-translocating membrane pyrophosphatase